MDAFYASVEQHENSFLKGKPVAVGGSRKRGVVAAASYEARRYGVKSAMPSVVAARLCPDLVFVKPRFELYKSVSKEIRSIFEEYTSLVEPLSLDEAYLDVTNPLINKPSATLIAQEIRKKIYERTHLTASAGISYCKFLAKIASDVNKPNGYFVILPEEAELFLEKLPIRKFQGIGKVTAEKMKKAGIFYGRELKMKSLNDLTLRYGKMGKFYYEIVRGIDNRTVNPDRERKSISSENTYNDDLYSYDSVLTKIESLVVEVFNRYQKSGIRGKTVTIKVKYSNFHQITRSRTLQNPIDSLKDLKENVFHVLETEDIKYDDGIRLLGVGISNLLDENPKPESQLTIDF